MATTIRSRCPVCAMASPSTTFGETSPRAGPTGLTKGRRRLAR